MKPAALILFFLAIPGAFAAKKPVSLDDVMNAGSRRGGAGDGAITWAPDGQRFLVNKSGKLSIYEVRSGKSKDVIEFNKLDQAAVKAPPAPVFDWTNRRVGENDTQWFSDGKRLLVAASGDLFVVDIGKGSFDQLTSTAEIERDPKLSPDNRFVSFRKAFDLYVVEIATGKLTRLTNDGSATLLNGQLDWVYPEELDLGTAHWWSPDSRSIAYLQFDISREPVFPQVSLLNPRGLLEPERYPKPGDPNAEVRVGIVPALGGQTKWMDLGEPRGNLMARVVWTPGSRSVVVERLPRVQNKLDLVEASAETGQSHVILHEQDATWINVKGEGPVYLADGKRFLWTSERDGFRHIYLYNSDGALQKQLTRGDWEVTGIVRLDEAAGRLYYMSSEASPLERQMYSVALDGSGKTRVSKDQGTHAIDMSPNGAYYLDNFNSLRSPSQTTLFKSDSSEVRVYRAPNRNDADDYDILPTEIVTVKAADGTAMYARMIKPAGFDSSKKYPAIVMVYGGPGVQQIHNAWQGISWDQALAHKGFVIWQLDNRGSTGRGHKWESVIYHNLGAQELADQKEGIKYLTGLGFVDPQRLGMYGWSYGGYMTLYTLTNAPGLIKAGIAGAPVTNWRNYDSIYTERYMGLPAENEDGYRNSAPTSKAAGLNSKLLIVHNIEDDNVHFANTVQMADALERAGKLFYMLIYPQKSHGVSGPVRKHLLEETTAFFVENLK